VPTLVVCLSAFSISSNGEPFADYDRQALAELSYPVVTGRAEVRGVTADELCPALYDLHDASLETGSGSVELSGLREPHDLERLVFTPRDYTVDALFDGERIPDVRSFHVTGERIEPPTDGSPALDVWIGWEGSRDLKREIERYASMHRLQIRVNHVPDTEAKLRTVVRARADVPDLVMIRSSSVAALTACGALQRLDYLPADGLHEVGIDSFRLDGAMWALPFYADVQLLYYNPTLVPLPLPKRLTTDSLESIAAEILISDGRRSITPMAWNGYSAYWFVPFLYGFGKEQLIDPDGGVTLDDEAFRKALTYVIHLRDVGYLEIAERDAMLSRFATGDIGIILSGSYSIPLFEELGIPFAVSAYPSVEESGRPIRPLLDFKGLAITRRTDAPVLARRLIEYLTGAGVQQRFCLSLTKIPANEAVYRTWVDSSEYGEVLAESAAVGTAVPAEAAYGVFKNTLWKLLRFVYSGRMTIDEALAEGQRLIDANLNTGDEHERR